MDYSYDVPYKREAFKARGTRVQFGQLVPVCGRLLLYQVSTTLLLYYFTTLLYLLTLRLTPDLDVESERLRDKWQWQWQ